jgi:hypothetical protein
MRPTSATPSDHIHQTVDPKEVTAIDWWHSCTGASIPNFSLKRIPKVHFLKEIKRGTAFKYYHGVGLNWKKVYRAASCGTAGIFLPQNAPIFRPIARSRAWAEVRTASWKQKTSRSMDLCWLQCYSYIRSNYRDNWVRGLITYRYRSSLS